MDNPASMVGAYSRGALNQGITVYKGKNQILMWYFSKTQKKNYSYGEDILELVYHQESFL